MTQEDFFKRYVYSPANDKLGGGAFGKVYKAYDTVLDKYVAVKVAEQMEVEGRKFTLADEFKALENLEDHVNIAKYEQFYTFESPQGIFDYAIMQYYSDGNLSQLIKNQQLTCEQKDAIALQLIDGIEFLHQYNVVHRDLKPSNILIHNRVLNGRKEYIPKVTDFGLSKKANAKTDAHFTNSFAAGTYSYSSPEQLKGGELMLNTDWWAYGTIVYEIFTGNALFKVERTTTSSSAVDVKEILDSILKNDISEKLNILPEKWQKAVAACLEREPEKRVKTKQNILTILGNEKSKAIDIANYATVVLPPQRNTQTIQEPVAKQERKENEKNVNKAASSDKNTTPKLEEDEPFWTTYKVIVPAVVVIIIGVLFSFRYIQESITEKILAPKGIVLPTRTNEPLESLQTTDKIPANQLDSFLVIGKNSDGTKYDLQKIENKNTNDVIDAKDEGIWKNAKLLKTKAAYENYIKQFPKGKYIQEAKTKLVELAQNTQNTTEDKEQKDWHIAILKNNIEGYKNYVAEYPNGKYITEAKVNIDKLIKRENEIDELIWFSTNNNKTKAAYEDYIKRFPSGKHISEAKIELQKIIQKEAEEEKIKKMQMKSILDAVSK